MRFPWGIKPATYNSILNKTAVSYKTNRMIGGKAPSIYVKSIQGHKQVGLSEEEMDKLLKSHLVDPQTLRSDDFDVFLRQREASLLQLIEQIMGKPVHQQTAEEPASPDDDEELEAA